MKVIIVEDEEYYPKMPARDCSKCELSSRCNFEIAEHCKTIGAEYFKKGNK